MAKNARSLRDPKRKPTHPGEILREDVCRRSECRKPNLPSALAFSRLTVSEILHEKRPVSVDMAIRIGKLLGNGAGLWLHLQQTLDVWQLEQHGGYEGIEQVEVEAA